ncbi:DUF4007 family protein [Peribacillus frigoritolerans]|uniref:DUF4007 family protein n=1 Tax=Peribacillus frigoritolerans TaxID=450367 RepID=UPI002B23F058|nr:DUF4007 family protein [Peribacillus frigoritolerans]MEB2492933.1 DUF4007 family protein [Peribacillus frigoritolerans]
MPYGQHQTFHLRDKWLSKALKNIEENERFFYDDEFEKVGLGKNMFPSLRFWAEATKIVVKREGKLHTHKLSELGKLILKYDKIIQLNDTASILHYNLVSDKDVATTWNWFFNIYPEKISTKDEMLEALKIWVSENEEKNIAESSLKKDIDVLVRLYLFDQSNDDPEEVMNSPLNKLNLLTEREGYIQKKSPTLSDIGLTALMYVLLQYCNEKKIDTITVNTIEKEKNLWGKVFNLNRRAIVSALEQLTKHKKYPVKFIRTNNLDDVQIPSVTPIEFLAYEYKRLEKELNVLL